MRKFTSKRDYFPDHTYSVWYDENDFPLGIVSISPPWLNNEIGKSCIPEGTYTLTPFKSPTKGDVYLFGGTEPRLAVELHTANFAFQLEGCEAPGLDFCVMINNGQKYPAVASSTTALDKIKKLTNYQPFQLTIGK